MNRRAFISMGTATVCGAALGAGRIFAGQAGSGIRWRRHGESGLFDTVTVDGRLLLVPEEGVGLLDGFCSIIEDGKPGREVQVGRDRPQGECGPVRISLAHRLRSSAGGSNEDLLEATLTLRSHADKPCEALCGFLTGARPCPNVADQQVYVPLSAAGLRDADEDPRRRLKDCRQTVGTEGFLGHYLEVQASDPRHSTTRATLLAPVVDVFAESEPWHVALFGSAVEPVFFEALQGTSARAWRVGRRVRLGPGQSEVARAFLLLHRGDATRAWSAFQEFGHHEDFPVVSWLRDVRVHYYDFLSAAAPDGPRGGGYDLNLKHFREFHVGLATQHGYYLSYGDFIHPDRKQWQAMPSDAAGPACTPGSTCTTRSWTRDRLCSTR